MPRVRAAQAADEGAAATLSSARAQRLPSLTFSASETLAKTGSSVWSGEPQSSLELTADLWRNGDLGAAVDSADIERRRVRAAFAGERAATKHALRSAFYRLSYASKQRDTSAYSFDVLDRQARSAQTQYRQGLRPQREAIRLDLQARAAKLSLDRADDTLFEARRDIAAITGEDAEFESLDLGIVKPSVAGEPALQISKAWSIVQADAAVEAADLQLRRSGYKRWVADSRLYAAGGWTQTGGFRDDVTSSWGARVGASLSFNLFDFGAASGLTESQRASLEGARARQASARADMTSRAAVLSRQLSRNAERLTEARRVRDLEENYFSALEEDYRNGRKTYLDLVDGLQNVSTARLSAASAARDYLVACSEIQSLGIETKEFACE